MRKIFCLISFFLIFSFSKPPFFKMFLNFKSAVYCAAAIFAAAVCIRHRRCAAERAYNGRLGSSRFRCSFSLGYSDIRKKRLDLLTHFFIFEIIRMITRVKAIAAACRERKTADSDAAGRTGEVCAHGGGCGGASEKDVQDLRRAGAVGDFGHAKCRHQHGRGKVRRGQPRFPELHGQAAQKA